MPLSGNDLIRLWSGMTIGIVAYAVTLGDGDAWRLLSSVGDASALVAILAGIMLLRRQLRRR